MARRKTYTAAQLLQEMQQEHGPEYAPPETCDDSVAAVIAYRLRCAYDDGYKAGRLDAAFWSGFNGRPAAS